MPRFWKERKNVLVLGGLLSAQLILLSLQVPLGDRPSVFEKSVFFLFAPLQRGLGALGRGIGGLWERYVHLGRVEERNRRLSDEAVRLRQENTFLRQGLAALEDQASAAAVLRSLGRAFRLAAVIGVDAVNPYKSVIIDAGSAQGFRPDMPVLDGRGRLIGRVIAPVGGREASVQLVTDENCAVAVFTEGSRVMGILSGDGKTGRCRMKYVLATNDAVKEGEVLVTSGFDRVFPPGLIVGTVTTIGADTSLFKRIAVAPFLDFRELKVVAVLTGRGGAGE